MSRYRSLIVVVLVAIAAAAGVAGWFLISEVSPQYLQLKLEERLSAALATPVTIQEITVSQENWIQLDARGVRAWPGEEGPGLEIPHVVGSNDMVASSVSAGWFPPFMTKRWNRPFWGPISRTQICSA